MCAGAPFQQSHAPCSELESEGNTPWIQIFVSYLSEHSCFHSLSLAYHPGPGAIVVRLQLLPKASSGGWIGKDWGDKQVKSQGPTPSPIDSAMWSMKASSR